MINTWNESLLHEALKSRYGCPNDVLEAPIEGSICDILHTDGSVTEIQTAHLGKLKPKIEKLLPTRPVRIVYPIAETTRLETRDSQGLLLSSRKSPKKGSIYQVFPELTGIYQLFLGSNLTLEVIFTEITEYRISDGTGSWRRKGIRIDDRKLDKINGSLIFRTPKDFLDLLPKDIPEQFTTEDLRAKDVGRFAGHMVWVLKKMALIEKIGAKNRYYLYAIRK